MSEAESRRGADELETEEYEIESEESDDIEAVMQDALKAVESSSVEPTEERGISPTQETSTASRTPAGSQLESEVDQLRAEVADLRDRSARTLADFDNFRKRAEKERVEERRFAAAELFRQLLPVVDNLERALSATGSEQDLKLGVELILRQLQEVLATSGVERVPAEGHAFDPQFHEAVSRHEDRSVDSPTVSEELQSGYTMLGRLLRPSVVKVAMPAVGDDAEGNATGGKQ